MNYYKDMDIYFTYIYKNYYFNANVIWDRKLKSKLKQKPCVILTNWILSDIWYDHQKIYNYTHSQLIYNKELYKLNYPELRWDTDEQLKQKLNARCP